jgi:hypothetical protein
VFFENDGITGSRIPRKIDLEEKRVCVPFLLIQETVLPLHNDYASPVVAPRVDVPSGGDALRTAPSVDAPIDENTSNASQMEEPASNDVVPNDEPQQNPVVENKQNNEPPRRSQCEWRPAISDDYMVYVYEDTNDIGIETDPSSFKEAMKSRHSFEWLDTMNDEMKSMSTNDVWYLVEIPKGAKTVGFKWVYKTKQDSKGNIERFKERLMAKGFTQREGIDYTKIFSPVSSKDSFRIIMTLVAHYDLELHQIDVNTTFLNGNLQENVYMAQPEGFAVEGKEHMGCKLKKSLYGLRQASRQWYIKFDGVIRSFDFAENKVDNCIYVKFKRKDFTILMLYVDGILLASSDKNILYETKSFLFSNFDMKDLGDASYVLGIEIHLYRTKGVLGLS